MKLVVQIPALNEEITIADVISRIPKDFAGITEVQVLVVDDGSTDRTAELAREAGAIVVSHETCKGVGFAFRTGVSESSKLNADIIVTIDADGQFDPNDISKVIAPIIDGNADFVTASRFMDNELAPVMPKAKRFGNDMIAHWLSSMIKKKFFDVSCGFRAYSRDAYLRLLLLGDFTYTHETFLTLAFNRLRIEEVPVKIRGVREHGKSRVASNLFNYGWRAATIILKTYRDYKPLKFFGILSFISFVLAVGFFSFLMFVKVTTGMFTPHKWSGVTGLLFLIGAFSLFFIGMVADMLDRIRVAQDETLFRVKKIEYSLNKNS
ncbi:MAG: glycosyltransferase family 2 protein [Kiritimatiellae bacterium]|jgi:glycosyltransferase involved in cell wall biosynthesis|nr:glycosyltransferase family 2 protein [Kiritimatiellia bacterium]